MESRYYEEREKYFLDADEDMKRSKGFILAALKEDKTVMVYAAPQEMSIEEQMILLKRTMQTCAKRMQDIIGGL